MNGVIRLHAPATLGLFGTEDEAIQVLTGLTVRGIPGTWERADDGPVVEFGGYMARNFSVCVEAADPERARANLVEPSLPT